MWICGFWGLLCLWQLKQGWGNSLEQGEGRSYSQASPRNPGGSWNQTRQKMMAKREEMALTGQPEPLNQNVGIKQEREGKPNWNPHSAAGRTNLAPSTLPSNPTHVPELGKVGRGKPSPTGSQPFILRRQKQCNTKSAGLFTVPAAPNPRFYWLLTLPAPDYLGMKLSLRFSASQWILWKI